MNIFSTTQASRRWVAQPTASSRGVSHGMAGTSALGVERQGETWQASQGVAASCSARIGSNGRAGRARRGIATQGRHGMASQGFAGHRAAKRGMARQARPVGARHGRTSQRQAKSTTPCGNTQRGQFILNDK